MCLLCMHRELREKQVGLWYEVVLLVDERKAGGIHSGDDGEALSGLYVKMPCVFVGGAGYLFF